ncbi:ferritin family protein [Bacillus sp. SCS-153A]|uniref:ferritin family protein n=1 Tax=Rossellomorea sedimentorum TaxID=3115294 RepID=UPI00390654E4
MYFYFDPPYLTDSNRIKNDLAKDIQRAINGEYSAILCYEELSKKAKTLEEKEQILEIQQDEKRHFKEFIKIFKSLTGTKPAPKVTEDCPAQYKKGLQAAFKDEQDTVDFYLEIADKADDLTIKRVFQRAAAEEQNHAVWFLYFLTASVSGSSHRQSVPYGAKGALEAASLTLPQMLNYAMQDEYLAQTRYTLIYQKFGEVRTFSKIKQAELWHKAALQPLFLNYSVPFPPDTSRIYATVPQTIKDAYARGVQGEIDNIAMYEKFLNYNLPADVRIVFTQLRNASQNHLAAFERGLLR